MEAKTSQSPRFDQLDAERFRDMIASPPFGIFMLRLMSQLERWRVDCERQEDIRAVHIAQGSVAALRNAIALPDMILKEMEGQRK